MIQQIISTLHSGVLLLFFIICTFNFCCCCSFSIFWCILKCKHRLQWQSMEVYWIQLIYNMHKYTLLCFMFSIRSTYRCISIPISVSLAFYSLTPASINKSLVHKIYVVLAVQFKSLFFNIQYCVYS